MNKILRFASYVGIIGSIFAIKVPFLSSIVAGYSVEMLIYYFFMFVAALRWIVVRLVAGKMDKSEFLLLCFCVFPFVFGNAFGYGYRAAFVDFIIFFLPIATFLWCRVDNINKQSFLKILSYTAIAGAVVSILVSVRVIETDIWAAEDQLVRAAGAVDSSLFSGSIIIFGSLLFIYPTSIEAKHKFLYRCAFIASCIGILFSQSRTRIFLAVIIMLIIFFMGFRYGYKSRYGSIRIIIFVVICVFVAWKITPDMFESILEQVKDRYSTVGDSDTNIASRSAEIKIQMEEFYASPIFGKGWGARAFTALYVHNIYTSVLMIGGIVFGGCFLFWYLGFFSRIFKSVKKNGWVASSFISFIILVVFAILGFTNAGIIQSGAAMTMMYVYLSDKHDFSENGE